MELVCYILMTGSVFVKFCCKKTTVASQALTPLAYEANPIEPILNDSYFTLLFFVFSFPSHSRKLP